MNMNGGVNADEDGDEDAAENVAVDVGIPEKGVGRTKTELPAEAHQGPLRDT